MIEHGVVRDIEDIILQLLQTTNARNLLVGLRISEDEIAKAHVLLHQMTEIHTHFLRVLIHKSKSLSLCLGTVFTLGALQYQRNKRIVLADIPEEFEACLRILLPAKGICTILRLASTSTSLPKAWLHS